MEKQKFTDKWPLTARGYLLFLIAIILLFNNAMPVSSFSIYMGITLLLTGGGVLFLYFKNGTSQNKDILLNVEGFLDVLTGLLVIIFSGSSGFAIYTTFGLYAITVGIVKLLQLYYCNRSIYIPSWFLVSIYTVMLVLGVVILVKSGSSKFIEFSLMGLYLIIYAVIYLVESFQPAVFKKYSL